MTEYQLIAAATVAFISVHLHLWRIKKHVKIRGSVTPLIDRQICNSCRRKVFSFTKENGVIECTDCKRVKQV